MSSNPQVLTHDITGRQVRITGPNCSLRIHDPASPYTWRWIGITLAVGQEIDTSIWYENLRIELAWVHRGERPWEFIENVAEACWRSRHGRAGLLSSRPL